MITRINRFLAAVLVPLLIGTQSSPLFWIKQQQYKPKELISLSQSEKITEDVHITAHRGVNAEAPENTIPAYQKAVEYGYYSAECDIRLTRDGVWVLSHTAPLLGKFSMLGTVERSDYDELCSYKYTHGTNFWEYPDLKIATLDEFLDVFEGAQTRPQIEIKTKDYDSLSSVVDAVRAHGMEKTAIIISFDLKQLQVIREYDSEIELWYLVYRIKQKDIDAAKALGNCWLSADRSLNGSKTIGMTLSQNVPLSLWTVDSIKDAEKLYEMGVRYMETDRLKN